MSGGLGLDISATTSLSNVYLWIIFGYLSSMIGCDVQNLMINNLTVRHIVGLVTFFFLFTSIDKNSAHQHVAILWLKTIILYVIFIMVSKSSWHFSAPVLVLLVIDMCIKTQEDYYSTNGIYYNIQLYSTIHKVIYITIVLLAFIGILANGVYEKEQLGDAFNLTKFVFDYKCN